jgi:hypothetical protein
MKTETAWCIIEQKQTKKHLIYNFPCLIGNDKWVTEKFVTAIFYTKEEAKRMLKDSKKLNKKLKNIKITKCEIKIYGYNTNKL